MKIKPFLIIFLAMMAKRNLKGSIKLKYGGKPNEVDADTFLKSLTGLTESIGAVGTEFGAGQVRIKVKALQPGSVVVELFVEPQRIQDLWAHIDPVAKILAIWVSYLTIKKLLRGEKPEQIKEKGNNIEIKHNKVTIEIEKAVFNSYVNSQAINEPIERAFEALNDDPSITNFEISESSNKSVFEAKREDFEGLAARNKLNIERQVKIESEVAEVTLFKLVLEKPYKWDVIYRENKIPVKIADVVWPRFR